MTHRLLATLAAAALVVAACGGDDDDAGTDTLTTEAADPAGSDAESPDATERPDTSAPSTNGGSPSSTPEATTGGDTPLISAAAGENMLVPAPESDDACTDDRVGGEATFGLARATAGLDPTLQLGSGTAGGVETAAVFDTLIVYDPSTGEYRPHIADSVSANEDLTEWTVHLRDDVYFANGDQLTTEAVAYSIDRMRPSTVSSAGVVAVVSEVEIVDDFTMVLKLDEPSALVLYLLAEDSSNITNPAVVESMTQDEFNLNPQGAGAGPYVVESFTPGESLVLRARDDYWGGPVCIEKLTFVSVPGPEASYEAFELGELDGTFLVAAPVQAAAAREAGYEVLGSVTNGQDVMIMNVGRQGADSPLADVRKRRAIAAAIDVDLIDQRAQDGLGIPGTALVADQEPWSPGVPGPQYDPALAAQLVEELKAEGWDGAVSIIVNDTPADDVEMAITVEGLLEAVGMDATLETLPTTDVNERITVEGRFDLAFFGISALEDAPYARYTSYQGGSGRNRSGYASDEMDVVLAELNQALTREEKKAAMAKIQEIWNRDVPSMIIAHGEWLVAHGNHVNGVFMSRDVVPMFFDTWLDQ